MLPLHLLISPATAPKYSIPQHRQQYGFSLLELVVVMGILSIFASVSLTFVGEKDVQQRYNESLEKLTMVKRNFFSVDKFQGQMVMHGFFIDNGMINDGMNENDRVDKCVEDSHMKVEDKGDEVEKDKCILKTAVSNSFAIILDKKIQDNNHYKIFELIEKIPVTNDVVTSGDKLINGAGLYKGIRPGAYDLSEYRDSEQQIKDAWGDEFLGAFINRNNDDDDDNDSYYYDLSLNSSPEYKNIKKLKKSISISTADLVFDVKNLEVSVEDLPTGTFKIALVTFKNTTCKDETEPESDTPNECDEPDREDYWQTIESEELTTTTTPSGNTFIVEAKDDDEGLIFDNEDIKNIEYIAPPVDSSASKKLANWTLTTEGEGEKEWKFSAQATPSTSLFTFLPAKISIGTHVVVLLESDTSTTPEKWKIYDSDSDPAENHINHIFEYLHIFRGQSQSSITMSIP